MEVSGQLHTQATLPPREKRSQHVELEAGWAPEPVRKDMRLDKYLVTAQIRTVILCFSSA